MKLRYFALIMIYWLAQPSFAMGYSSTYLSCIGAAGSNTASAAMCMRDEFNVQNKRVKNFFNIILKQAKSSEKKAQKENQKQWFIARDRSCGKQHQSQSDDHAIRYYSCALKASVQQANSLERQTYYYQSTN